MLIMKSTAAAELISAQQFAIFYDHDVDVKAHILCVE